MSDATSDTRFLRVIGQLHPDNRLVLRPSYLTTRPKGAAQEPDGVLIAELVGPDDRVLLRSGVDADPYLADGPGARNDVLAVRAWLPFPDATRILRFLHHGVVVLEEVVGDTPPDVRLRWSPEGEIAGSHEIRW